MVPKGPRLITIWVCLKLYGTSLRPWVHQCSPMFTMIFPTKKQPFGGIPYFQPKGHIHKYVCFGTGVPHGTPAFRPVRLGWGDASLMLVFFIFRTEIAIWRYPQFSVLFIYIYIYLYRIFEVLDIALHVLVPRCTALSDSLVSLWWDGWFTLFGGVRRNGVQCVPARFTYGFVWFHPTLNHNVSNKSGNFECHPIPSQSLCSFQYNSGWWFGTVGLFFHSVGNVIIPTDFHFILF